jgi:hypothetical protein
MPRQPRRRAGRQAGAHRRGEEALTEVNGTSELETASCGYFLWVLSETLEDLDFIEVCLDRASCRIRAQ